jgi:signal peptidase I
MNPETPSAGNSASPSSPPAEPSLGKRLVRELISWLWVILIFLFVTGTMVQARVIPSGSMENTLLVGDHLLMNRLGYDVSLPFTPYHQRLWREPHRQQVIIFRSVNEPGVDLIKRLIGLPGDAIEIRSGVVYVNGKTLNEPYAVQDASASPDPSIFPPTNSSELLPGMEPEWADKIASYVVNGKLVVPPGHYFVLGDNRGDSYDSRYWGFVPEANILGTPLIIYMSVSAPDQAWEPGQIRERIAAYGNALLHPWKDVRWRRLFMVF